MKRLLLPIAAFGFLLSGCAAVPLAGMAGASVASRLGFATNDAQTFRDQDAERLRAGQPAQYTSMVTVYSATTPHGKGRPRTAIGGATVTECDSTTFPLAHALVSDQRYMTVSRAHGMLVIGPLGSDCTAPAGAQTLPLAGQSPLLLPGQTSPALVDVQPLRPLMAGASGTGGGG